MRGTRRRSTVLNFVSIIFLLDIRFVFPDLFTSSRVQTRTTHHFRPVRQTELEEDGQLNATCVRKQRPASDYCRTDLSVPLEVVRPDNLTRVVRLRLFQGMARSLLQR